LSLIPVWMSEDRDEKPGIVGWLRERMHIAIGIAGLFAWFAMLWLMFGDVL
jgi:hypothetical protein